MYLAHQFDKGSLPTLGRKFGNRDHTTILHAIRKIARKIDSDATFAGEIEAIRAKLLSACGKA
jgi:chromosomal replication initiator protein